MISAILVLIKGEIKMAPVIILIKGNVNNIKTGST